MTTDSGTNPHWLTWLDQAMRAAGLNPDKDGPRLDAMTGTVTPSMRSNWKNRGGVSPSVVADIAKALGANPLEGLRAAGHNSLADSIVAGLGDTPPTAPAVSRDRIERRIEEDSGMQPAERRRWLTLYHTEIEAVRARFDASLDLARKGAGR